MSDNSLSTREGLLRLVSYAVLILTLTVAVQAREFDYSKMTPEEIQELRQLRHEFYAAETEGMEEAIMQALLDDQIRVDGNQNDFDVRYYGIDLRLDFSGTSISGHVDYQIRPVVASLSEVVLNLTDDLTVTAITVDGVPVTYAHAADLIDITLPISYSQGEEFEMTVSYNGIPRYAGHAGMMFNTVSGYPMCWTHCSPYASRFWWPCKDYPVDKADSVDLFFEYPSDYVCVSNGAIVSDIDIGGGYNRIHYSHNYPITTYLVAVACGEFEEYVETWNYDAVSMPVYAYPLPGEPDSENAFRNVLPDVLTRLSNLWGLYPFAQEKCGGACYGWGGAMEHQTCAFYNPTFVFDWVIAHETGHQWWGDMLGACNFHHVWLKEGFASYTEAVYIEDRDGSEAYFNYMQTQKFLGPGSVYVDVLTTDSIFDPSLTYDKGSWVLHMLRGVIGDSLFFESVGNYRAAYEYGCAVTDQLADIVSGTVGEDMSWFFDEWVYGEGNPIYNYSSLCEPASGRDGYNLVLFIEQIQEYGTIFKMPIRLSFTTTAGQLDTVIWNEGDEAVYEIPFSDSVTAIEFDSLEWILRAVNEVPFALHMMPRELPDGNLGLYYHFPLRAVGGEPPYTWAKLGGDMPFGLSFDADSALIKGTPSWPATYYFTLQVTDSDSPANTETYGFALTILDYICGDADGNSLVNISDAVYLVSYIFSGGPAPDPLEAGDVDCNDLVNISDAVYLITYIFSGGPAPCAACP